MERLIAASTKCFPYKSATEASEAFKSQLDINSCDNKGNDAVSGALFVVRDEITAAIEKIMTIERFIALSTPPMEDGNNFGVTVQMMVAKFSKDVKDELTKILDSLPGYFDARAGAYEKVRCAGYKGSFYIYCIIFFRLTPPSPIADAHGAFQVLFLLLFILYLLGGQGR